MAGVVPVELVAHGLHDTHGSQRWRSHRCRQAAIDTFPLLVLSGRMYGISLIEHCSAARRHRFGDPASGALVIVTKDFRGTARVYAADRARPGTTTTLRRAGSLSLGAGEAVTAGDVSPDGRTIVIRTYGRAFVWSRRGESVASALRGRACAARADLLVEGQSETLALTANGRAFFAVPEGIRPTLRRWAPG